MGDFHWLFAVTLLFTFSDDGELVEDIEAPAENKRRKEDFLQRKIESAVPLFESET